MGKKISVDTEDLRTVGKEICPAMADQYEEVINKANAIRGLSNRVFGSTEASDSFERYFELFHTCVYETGYNLLASGKTLESIAENDEVLEQDLSNEFSEISEEIGLPGFTPNSNNEFWKEIDTDGREDKNKDDPPNGDMTPEAG